MRPSCIKQHLGAPRLFVEGQPLPIGAYMTYAPARGRFADFARAGYALFSLPIFFATRPINDISQIPPFRPGIFEGEIPDFSAFDEDLARMVAACPHCMVFPRVNLSMPIRWTDAHPQELCDTGFTEHHRECFASRAWLEAEKELLRQFILHLQNIPDSDRIIGFQLACGNTEEWFPFDMKGGQGLRSRESFLGGDEEAFYRHLSQVTVSAIVELAEYVKELTGHRHVVGAFYGYTLECVDRNFAHHAMGKLLSSPAIDFLCSPVSYMETRPVGMDHANMTALDSIRLHGKLYFAENDTRTDLSRPPNDLPHYNSPVWFGPDRAVSCELMKLHFARALCHSHSFWWFDMWGGWYDAPEYRALLQVFSAIAKDSLAKPLASVSRVAVFVDELAYAAMADPRPAQKVCYSFRKTLGYLAQAYDIFLASDFDAVQSRYPCIILLEPRETALSRHIRQLRPDALVITPENCGMSAARLRCLCAERNAPALLDADAVVYENESYLFLHTPKAGFYSPILHLSNIDLFTGAPIDLSSPLSAGKSYLFAK